jgi:hypothetical protein
VLEMIKTFERVNSVRVNYTIQAEGPATLSRSGPIPPWQTGNLAGRHKAAWKRHLYQPGNGKNITGTTKPE